MGMFDYVIGISVKCPNCGREHNYFQSKDGDCALKNIDYRLVSNFYTVCNCGYWIEYRRKPAEGLSDFETVREEEYR